MRVLRSDRGVRRCAKWRSSADANKGRKRARVPEVAQGTPGRCLSITRRRCLNWRATAARTVNDRREWSLEDFVKALPMHRILSAGFFDVDAYRAFHGAAADTVQTG